MKRLTGRWRIVEMDMWDREAIDLIEPGFIEFGPDRTGEFGFVALRGSMDCRTTKRDGHTAVEFTWDGDDEGDHVSGRGRATMLNEETLEGHLFIHWGDDSGFRAVRTDLADRPGRR
ncbi:hypothetical protein ACWDTG_23160 [Rhodococcus zopfii]|uniref:hypothetical protein n=1 Tax=Rhodococcus zopfii TaxID=43772 RepID=UPI0011112DA7|nr:hypothetical protein [Rhodococcus zopfii]